MVPATRAWLAILLHALLLPAALGVATGCGPSSTQDRTDVRQQASAPIIPREIADPPTVAPLPRLDEEVREALRARELVASGHERFVGAYSAMARSSAINAALELRYADLPPETEEDAGDEVEATPENSPEWWSYAGPANEATDVWLDGNPDSDYEVDSLLPIKVFDRHGGIGMAILLESMQMVRAAIETLERLDPARDIVLIPTSALSAFLRPDSLKPLLERFVSAGGRLVVLCQRTAALYSLLPRGNEIEAVGWNEVRSGYTAAARLGAEHPALSGVPGRVGSTVSLGVDGYFRKLPAGAEVLLRANGSDMPVLASYSFGAGRVFVTSLFEDRSHESGRSSTAGASILRNLIEWLRKPVPLPIFLSMPSGAVEVGRSIRVRNFTQWPATQVTFHWIDPSGSIVYEEPCPVDLFPGEESMESATWLIPQPAMPGIWFVDYSLQDARWPVQIRGLDPDSRFVVTASRTRDLGSEPAASSALPGDSSRNETAPKAPPPQ